MADNPASNDENTLSNTIFIAVISSVGSVVFIITVIMILIFGCLCYREYRSRRSNSPKNSDRVGLLHTKDEDEVVSDQEESGSVPMTSVPHQRARATSEKKPPILASINNGSKVSPEPPTQQKRKSEQPAADTCSAEREEKLVRTMIGGDEETVDQMNAGLDDTGDKASLVPPKKKQKRKVVDMEARATMLGRPISYMEELSKSSPLDAQAIVTLTQSPEVAVLLTREYKGVPSNSAVLPNLSPAEKAKNRYRNVLPNPHSAVHLKYTGTDGSSYINANFIKGLHGEENGFIAAQGPTYDTMVDFWRMIWEQNTSIIVMLTNLVENGRHKCVKYWPPVNDQNVMTYGNIEVTKIDDEQVPSCYMLTQLSVGNIETGEKRMVYHFWCIAWPDFGIPKVAEPILKLRAAVDEIKAKTPPAPMVVHCSAGLGRSGTFISIHMGVQQFEEEGLVDPLKYLCNLRQDRGGMIQTEDQYLFVHQALAEHMN